MFRKEQRVTELSLSFEKSRETGFVTKLRAHSERFKTAQYGTRVGLTPIFWT